MLRVINIPLLRAKVNLVQIKHQALVSHNIKLNHQGSSNPGTEISRELALRSGKELLARPLPILRLEERRITNKNMNLPTSEFQLTHQLQ
jgi:hypothetical protein